MRTVTLITLFLFLSVVTSYAEEIFLATLKNGNVLTWTNYQEQENQYCTQKSYGMYCLDKKDVVSVKKEDDSPTGATVVHHNVTAEEKKELVEQQKRRDKELKEFEQKEEHERNARKYKEEGEQMSRAMRSIGKTLMTPKPMPNKPW